MSHSLSRFGPSPREALGTLLFLHGAGHDRSVWEPAARLLGDQGLSCVCIDLPGHGQSDGNALTTVPEMADWLVETIVSQNLPSVTLAGHSLGSLVAIESAARAPDHVTGLALIATTAPMRVADTVLEMATSDVVSASAMLARAGLSRASTRSERRLDGTLLIDVIDAVYARCPKGVLASDLGACARYDNGLTAAESIRCPTLMLLGSEDRLTPVSGTAPLQSALPHASVKVFANCGHTIMLEATEQTVLALYQFMQRQS